MYIVSINVEKRDKEVPEIQSVLTKYGEAIDTRLGIHTKDKHGLIIVVYSKENVEQFAEELNAIGDVEVNFMEA